MATFTAGDKFANCFVCSPTNPRGLHLKITTVDGKAHTEIVPEDYMCGLNGLMHGGFSLMLMDEVMYYADEGYGSGQCYASFRMRLQKPRSYRSQVSGGSVGHKKRREEILYGRCLKRWRYCHRNGYRSLL